MKQIRRNVFETNSSSTHSISIVDTKGMYDTILPDEDGNIVLEGGEFGWEIKEYSDPLTKANYCAIDNEDNQDRLDMLIEVIKEHTNCKEVIIKSLEDSYIDHQSAGNSDEAFWNKESLRIFLFSPSSTLYTDNDNH